jgi:hypothetical protein
MIANEILAQCQYQAVMGSISPEIKLRFCKHLEPNYLLTLKTYVFS